ncbi:carboxylesterase/lipase family protein [Chelativorans salis]|uniref:Carboxylic ester hydrolase n=1 Tax=Chelativorans salis TaxID=2978478 RepID=A0ABT2LQG0_9HYPH|nr:carboxylesterase family protein [Chelativorans sp. EGI FJ00035]MCT7376674.1 carboxylesterase family protein [Chelativorans sp. EGI FJ00035]
MSFLPTISRFSRQLGFALAAGLLAANTAGAQTVTAPAGEFRGTSTGGLDIYQGIPYAEAPVGDLRWAPPQPKAPFTEPFEATDPGNECVQFATFWRPDRPASWTEDCLSLTVYVPPDRENNLPVFVGYHGGGSVNGAKTDWHPRELALAGSVVVTANYRLGAMGYLALDLLNAESKDGQSSGNYGDLDKVQVLRWVKENISAFGGDPNRVTIAGQSAGARGVCFLLASPEAAGLFHGAVMQSGRECPSTSNADQVEAGNKFVGSIGCADAEDTLACLREKSPAEVLTAQADSELGFPTTYGGYALPKPPLEAFRSGEFNRVPVIIGNTRNETRVFIYEGNDLQKQPVTLEKYESTVRERMGDKADAVLAAYKESAATAPGMAQGDFDTDQRYICGTHKAVDALGEWTPTFAYEFADETAPIRSYASVPPSFDLGVPHSAELPYLWGEDTVPNGLTAEQQKLAELMRAHWISLTDPQGMAATVKAEWPAYTPDGRQRIVFSAGGETSIVPEDQYLADHNCDLFAR